MSTITTWIKDYKTIILLVLITLLIVGSIILAFLYNRSLNTIDEFEEQEAVRTTQIQAENERILKENEEALKKIEAQYALNLEEKEDEIQKLNIVVEQSTVTANSLYDSIGSTINTISSETSNEEYIRYFNVLYESYRETNDAYGEAGESLERARIELNKCIADVDAIYELNDQFTSSE